MMLLAIWNDVEVRELMKSCLDFMAQSRLTPMQKAPPKSLSVTHGQGSLEWSIPFYKCVDAPKN